MSHDAADLLDLVAGVGVRADTFRFDLLDASLSTLGTIDTERGKPPTVVNNINAVIKRTATFTPRPGELNSVNLFANRVKPVMVLQDGTEYPLGVFMFADASHQRYSWGTTPTVQLVDQCLIVDQGTENTVGYAAGTDIAAAITSLLAAVGISNVSIGVSGTVGAPMTWPPGTSRLTIINELAANAGGYSLFFSNAGVATVIPAPTLDSPNITYSDATARVLAGSIVESDDALSAPNRFIVISGDANAEPIVGYYDVPTDAPHSALNRGYVVARTQTVQGLSSSADATARARAWAEQSMSQFEWLQFASPLDPRHDTFDVVSFQLTAAHTGHTTSPSKTFREQGWTMTLQSGAQMVHDLRRSYDA